MNSALYPASNAETQGVLITGITPNGPADRAGIEENDRILKVGKVKAVSPTQMMDVLANMTPGTQVKVLVLRDENTFETIVTIGEFPEIYE